ncbi:MAG: hypothetical protein PHN67_07760 [Bacteroidales bacterium]|nr:hypothetical protein [Bacteroidales bacterium]
MKKLSFVLFVMALSGTLLSLCAQEVSQEILDQVYYRNIGSTRHGGRFVDFAVYEKNPSLFYAALASGGVWKTENNGQTFTPIFDDAGAISIGDIAIDQNNPDLIWVGTGEANNSRTAYYGDGVYKSTDGGKTWQHMGLKDSHHIGRIIIHPKNPDIVWVAAEGPLYSDNLESGVFKTTDGGKTWKRILKVEVAEPMKILSPGDEPEAVRPPRTVGFVDLAIDPSNPNTLYAASYDKERRAWTFNAGGPNSALYKTTNGGKSWTKLEGGLPTGVIGRIGVAVSPSKPNVVYANVENCNIEGISFEERWDMMKKGINPARGQREMGDEMYRSDNGGRTWRKVSPDGQDVGGGPAYYYQQICINPTNPDHLYVLGVRMWETVNAGKEWRQPFRFGGDNHAMWINPQNPKHMMLGYDHGMGITYDAGINWYHPDFMPVGQFVAVGFDYDYPYNVYGGLQDNGSVKGPSTKGGSAAILMEDWSSHGGGDGMYNVVDWSDSRWLYTESQFGPIARIDQSTGERTGIQYRNMDRWAWNAPIVVSHHNPSVIYHAGNKVVRSSNRGDNWQEISPDLTTADSTRIGRTGNIQYCTIVTMEESYLEPGVLWVGTDDGKVWVTQNDGKDWTDVTDNIPGHPGYWVSRVEPSHFDSGTAYVTITGYRNDDFKPFIWKTTDYGKSWESLASGLPDEPICVIREHYRTPDLLFIGTTKQVHVSFDGGRNWQSLRGNMPYVACEDLKIHPRENDLIVATHGRSLWIADISWVEQLTSGLGNQQAYLFQPKNRVQWKRLAENHSSSSNFSGESEAAGVPIRFYLKDSDSEVVISIFDGPRLIHEMKVEGQAGLNQVTWNYQKRVRERTAEEMEELRKRMERFRGAGRAGGGRGVSEMNYIMTQAGPGDYTVKLSAGGSESKRQFTVARDSWR